jgi:adenine-specific DNA methylase
MRVTEKARTTFLEAFASGTTVVEACRLSGLATSTVYTMRKRDEEFAARWADALEQGTEMLEAEARRRAMKSSDLLMIFLLKARRPEVYRERREVMHSGSIGPSVEDLEEVRQTRRDPEREQALLRLVKGGGEGA